MDNYRAPFKVYPGSDMPKSNQVDDTGKIVLPMSTMEKLVTMKIVYPMMFRVSSSKASTHCGVLEFTAKEGTMFMPSWMMEQLQLKTGDVAQIQNVSMAKGTFIKIRPHTKEFIELYNPRIVLQRALEKYTCITKGDTITVAHNGHQYYIDITQCKAGSAELNQICIIETDIQVDFERPLDMPPSPTKAPAPLSLPASGGGAQPAGLTFKSDVGTPKAAAAPSTPKEEPKKFVPFSGAGRTLGGK